MPGVACLSFRATDLIQPDPLHRYLSEPELEGGGVGLEAEVHLRRILEQRIDVCEVVPQVDPRGSRVCSPRRCCSLERYPGHRLSAQLGLPGHHRSYSLLARPLWKETMRYLSGGEVDAACAASAGVAGRRTAIMGQTTATMRRVNAVDASKVVSSLDYRDRKGVSRTA
jgi:hypothetical protein